MNEFKDWSKHEVFSGTCIPPESPFFVRLDGWKFKRLSASVDADKPFDKNFAMCLVSSGKILFKSGFNPALVYIVSDELNILFHDASIFRGRIEKIDSVLASLASSTFTLNLQKFFKRKVVGAFDSRIVLLKDENIHAYLVWRQMNAWRNHNNAYAYWALRKMGHKPLEISRKLRGLKTEELHEMMFKLGLNLAKTPAWQRRGILIYKHPILINVGNLTATRWKVKVNWNLPLFTSEDGIKLIKQILEWTMTEET
ncbi:MAG: tRNA(His) guanylyltransferase Thg1 family protein [Candidatus Bathyarchaeia archaeon]